MELKIINKKEEPLLLRTRMESEIVFEKATPSREEIKKELVKASGKDEKLIVVKSIYTEYGLKKAKNVSYVYEDEKSLKRVEIKNKKARGEKKKVEKEGKEKAGKAKEQAKEEKKPAKPEQKQ